ENAMQAHDAQLIRRECLMYGLGLGYGVCNAGGTQHLKRMQNHDLPAQGCKRKTISTVHPLTDSPVGGMFVGKLAHTLPSGSLERYRLRFQLFGEMRCRLEWWA